MDLKEQYRKIQEELDSHSGERLFMNQDTNYLIFKLKDQMFTSQHVKISSRMLSYYEEKDILLFVRKGEKGWKGFSFFGLIWLYIIEELRTFGYPVNLLKKLKDFGIVPAYKAGWDDSYLVTIFEFAIADRIRLRDPMYMIIFNDGSFTFFSERFLSLAYTELTYMAKPHISIPLSQIILQAWDQIPIEKWNPKPKLEFQHPEFIYIGEKEADILNEMMSGKYERIIVRFESKKPIILEMHEILSAKDQLNKILNERSFQDIHIKRKDGKTVFIERVNKRKL